MAERIFTDTSAIHYGGGRRNNVTRPSKGSGKTVKIHDDLRSALVHEVVEQLNEARVSERFDITAADAATKRVALISAKSDLFIEELALLNGQTAAFANAATDIKIGVAEAGDVDLEAGPAAPDVKFFAEGFAANNFPAKSEKSLTGFDATDTDALTQAFERPFVLKAGQVLYAEFVNNEGAEKTLGVRVEHAITDRLALQPRDYQRKITLPTRRFARSEGRLD